MSASAPTRPWSACCAGTSLSGSRCRSAPCLAIGWSFIIGYPLFKLKGHYFAIATIATSLVLKDLFEVWKFVGAARGLGILPYKYHPPDFLATHFQRGHLLLLHHLRLFHRRPALHELVPQVPPRLPAALHQRQRGGGPLPRHQRSLGEDQDLRHRHRFRERRRLLSRRLHQEHRAGRHHEPGHLDPDCPDGHARRGRIALGARHRRRGADPAQELPQGVAGGGRRPRWASTSSSTASSS